MTRSRYAPITAVATMMLLATACSGDGGDAAEPTTTTRTVASTTSTTEPATTTTTTTTQPPTTTTTTEPPTTTTSTAAPEGVIPANDNAWQLQPSSEEDITAGPVEVYWYRGTGGNYVAVFTGPGIAGARAAQQLCTGTSILAPDYMHESNAPTVPGSCGGYSPNVVNLQACDPGVWIYETLIPGDLEGTLRASLLWRSEELGVVGLAIEADTMPGMPEFEPGLASYSVPPSFTPDGSTVIKCFDTTG